MMWPSAAALPGLGLEAEASESSISKRDGPPQRQGLTPFLQR